MMNSISSEQVESRRGWRRGKRKRTVKLNLRFEVDILHFFFYFKQNFGFTELGWIIAGVESKVLPFLQIFNSNM